MKIYIWYNEEALGPYTVFEISSYLKEGLIDLQTFAHREGDAEWSVLEEILKTEQQKYQSIRRIETGKTPRSPSYRPRRIEHEPSSGMGDILFPLCFLILLIAVGAYVFRPPEIQINHVVYFASAKDSEVSERTGLSEPAQTVGLIAVSSEHTDEVHSNDRNQQSDESSTATSFHAVSSGEGSRNTGSATQISGEPSSPSQNGSTVSAPTASPAAAQSSAPLQSQTKESAPMAEAPSPIEANNAKNIPVESTNQKSQNSTPIQPVVSRTPLAIASTATPFFSIESVKLLRTVPSDKNCVWVMVPNPPDKPPGYTWGFAPCLKIQTKVQDTVRTDTLIFKVYFYNDSGKLIETMSGPSPCGHLAPGEPLPVLFTKDKIGEFYFQIPASVKKIQWSAIIVFGDKDEAHAACYPETQSYSFLDFPEKKLVSDRSIRNVERYQGINPLIEKVIPTKSPQLPQLSLFLRYPKGVSKGSEVKGVIAMCVLGFNLPDVKKDLQKEEMTGDYYGVTEFANKYKFAIIAWPASWFLWESERSHDEIPKDLAKKEDKNFDIVADAWAKGVDELVKENGIPGKDFLLWGCCASAQWAHRICIRKPDYFLAACIQISGSFDKPTPEANKVMWCIITGELYSGYDHTNKFVAQCRALGYPLIYKAEVGLGHSGDANSSALAYEFFRFAITQKEARDKYDERNENGSQPVVVDSKGEPVPWNQLFQSPPYYGDTVNQDLFPSAQVAMIPKSFRTPLPSDALARVWNYQPPMSFDEFVPYVEGNKEAVIFDARPRDIYKKWGHIPKALNLSRVNFDEDYASVKNLLEKDRTQQIIVYDWDAHLGFNDGAFVRRTLEDMGYSNVLLYGEGFWGWLSNARKEVDRNAL